MEQRQKALAALDGLGISYELIEHPPVYTIQEMEELGLCKDICVLKNLFLRDAKGKRHFLVCIDGSKTADLAFLQERLGSTKLGFASEERLMKYLGLTKGAVTPLGLLNDESKAVELIFDASLKSQSRIGVHPNDNTATVVLDFASLARVLEENGAELSFIEL